MEHMLKVWILFAVLVVGGIVSFILDRVTGSKDAFAVILFVVIVLALMSFAKSSEEAEENPQSMEEVRKLSEKEYGEYAKKAEKLSDPELLAICAELERSFEQDQRPIVAVRKARMDAANSVRESRGL